MKRGRQDDEYDETAYMYELEYGNPMIGYGPGGIPLKKKNKNFSRTLPASILGKRKVDAPSNQAKRVKYGKKKSPYYYIKWTTNADEYRKAFRSIAKAVDQELFPLKVRKINEIIYSGNGIVEP